MVEISLASIRRIMKKAGINRVSKDAVEALRDLAEEYIFKLSQLALELADHAGRKTILKQDILMAARIWTRKMM